ncbi:MULTISPECIES: alpha-L-glutamate ligase [unclassified Streptomyces]|uniref:ATP-grasp domain-containing protein n=1 Tax=unclassified Streptomyces TaxID=2593676 RepID=UPI000DC7D04F|nr:MULTISPECIES: alpha-L-glutamate ligase [unclassified Streptomyces]AWZ08413.1 alpha-L-glutamate ligase [Streptomyces sp. ICC4]AWZ16189.1 alpha-L-glutamate ligase [Streptomyces sp. ICC1]
MRIGLITDNPGHPLLSAAAGLLRVAGHVVEPLDPGAPDPGDPAPADVYLLKAHTPHALDLARRLEGLGAPVVNSAAATTLCQDRTLMAELAVRAGLPFAGTRTFGTLARWADGASLSAPVVVKSRHSRRRDLVALVEGAAALKELAGTWPDEPVVVQDFAPNSGWDHKLWAIGDRVFAALRRSELSPEGRGPTLPLPRIPAGWAELTLRVGEVFSLDVYGVDLIATADGSPLIVDVNAFPGIREQPGAPEALAELALKRAGRPAG